MCVSQIVWRKEVALSEYDGRAVFYRFLSGEFYGGLTLSQGGDGDYWLAMCFSDAKIENSVMASCRFRSPFAGGGNMEHGFRGIGLLLHELYRCCNENDKELLLQGPPPAARGWVWRHLDEGAGYIGVAVCEGGDVLLSLIPCKDDLEQGSACLVFRHADISLMLQHALLGFHDGLVKDNLERPGYSGNHAY